MAWHSCCAAGTVDARCQPCGSVECRSDLVGRVLALVEGRLEERLMLLSLWGGPDRVDELFELASVGGEKRWMLGKARVDVERRKRRVVILLHGSRGIVAGRGRGGRAGIGQARTGLRGSSTLVVRRGLEAELGVRAGTSFSHLAFEQAEEHLGVLGLSELLRLAILDVVQTTIVVRVAGADVLLRIVGGVVVALLTAKSEAASPRSEATVEESREIERRWCTVLRRCGGLSNNLCLFVEDAIIALECAAGHLGPPALVARHLVLAQIEGEWDRVGVEQRTVLLCGHRHRKDVGPWCRRRRKPESACESETKVARVSAEQGRARWMGRVVRLSVFVEVEGEDGIDGRSFTAHAGVIGVRTSKSGLDVSIVLVVARLCELCKPVIIKSAVVVLDGPGCGGGLGGGFRGDGRGVGLR